MKIPKNGSSLRQQAYARRVWGADGPDKKSIALDVGYSPNAAKSIVSKIESRPGFQNAIAILARESNNLALEIMNELKARGTQDFSNKDLIGALKAISSAWEKFNAPLLKSLEPREDNKKNRLRTIVLERMDKPVANAGTPEVVTVVHDEVEEWVEEGEDINNLDF